MGTAAETLEYLKTFCEYNPETGNFICIRQRGNSGSKVGTALGSATQNGLSIWIFTRMVYVHRLAWLWMTGDWPSDTIDHIDGNNLNNKWSNLRCVPHAKNMRNQRKRTNNTSGYTGVAFNTTRGTWGAYITAGSKTIRICTAATKEEAFQKREQYIQENPQLGFTARHGK